MENEFEKAFDSHELFNKWQVYGGNRVNTSNGTMSVYICEIKLKKFLRRLTHEEIEDLYVKEMSAAGIEYHRKKLVERVENLLPWQLFKAIEILYETEDSYKSFEFILLCKMSDNNLEEHNERIKNDYSTQ